MKLTVETDVRAAPEAVWRIVADIENAASTVEAIESVEVLEPARGPSLVGLKWRETRTMFGKQATEVMWVTDARDGSHYETRAESHGAVYRSRVAVDPDADGARLSMTFQAQPVTLGAKVMWGVTGFLFKGATRKALAKDLADIKAAAEGR